MKKSILISAISIIALLFTACGPNREERISHIEELEDSIFEHPALLDSVTADGLTALYVEFADKYPSDTLAPSYLIKAAETQSNVLHTERAVSLFDRVIKDYPDYYDVPMCYFLKGTAYEQGGQYDEARKAYQEFINKYPEHFMAQQVSVMLPYVGLSPEEMLDSIMAHATDTLLIS